MGEELDPTKKFVKIKKLSPQRSSSSAAHSNHKKVGILEATLSGSSTDHSENRSVHSRSSNNAHASNQGETENEQEIQVVDLEKENEEPVSFSLLSEKKGKQEDSSSAEDFIQSVSNVEVKKRLIVRKTKISNVITSREGRRKAIDLSALMKNEDDDEDEDLESDENIEKKKKGKKKKEETPRPRANSTDADVSEDDDD